MQGFKSETHVCKLFLTLYEPVAMWKADKNIYVQSTKLNHNNICFFAPTPLSTNSYNCLLFSDPTLLWLITAGGKLDAISGLLGQSYMHLLCSERVIVSTRGLCLVKVNINDFSHLIKPRIWMGSQQETESDIKGSIYVHNTQLCTGEVVFCWSTAGLFPPAVPVWHFCVSHSAKIEGCEQEKGVLSAI